MKRHFFYNILLNVGIIVLILAGVAAYNSEAPPDEKYAILATALVGFGLLGYLKYRLLKKVRQLTQKD